MIVKKVSSRLGYAVWFLASVVLLFGAMRYEAIDNFIVAFLLLGLLQFVATIIHELGHAWAAVRVGARVHEICAVPFVYNLQKRSLRFERYLPDNDIGGYVTYDFRGNGSSRKQLAIAAAGPAANLASAAAVSILAALLSGLPTEISPIGVEPIVLEAPDPAAGPEAPSAPSAPALIFPSQAQIDADLKEARAERRRKAAQAWMDALVALFIAVSIVLGIANLVPEGGSDGAQILKNWRALRGIRRR